MEHQVSEQKPPRDTEQTPSAQDWERAEQRSKPRGKRCSYCGAEGHNLRTCPELNKPRSY